ncbi:hypothetical protein TIFTF001_017365 [Ficus carica]|uniref:Uncharacterized protein n=1 Tax=Ficus carica TaxID=3494 RepID=A0AA88AQK6_FICCA|nr:hypothetical protein TIFTF001_017365 [Ficus carica]
MTLGEPRSKSRLRSRCSPHRRAPPHAGSRAPSSSFVIAWDLDLRGDDWVSEPRYRLPATSTSVAARHRRTTGSASASRAVARKE